MFNIDSRSTKPIYEQIVDNIKELYLRDILKPEDKLPSVREMARLLEVNPNTVARAYQELELQNIIYSSRGRGTFIKELDDGHIDRERLKGALEELRQLCIDLIYLGLSKEDLIREIEEVYLNMEGGDQGVRSRS